MKEKLYLIEFLNYIINLAIDLYLDEDDLPQLEDDKEVTSDIRVRRNYY